ncbi:Protein of unknown function [Pedobacter terrae]|uniref:DUF3800 domain-containing protein n=1 Tax=Pedobacter terrae TaxID=405671 RepID=A0A1G7QLN7_9SPHI|nr:DUF3800 domain-containing protein [Pedobacter terrae]SDF99402.1 Protein of unknown function [Pedobacter terrae]
MTFNLFLDESCHFEKDNSSVMCIGYIKVPEASYQKLYECIRSLKLEHKSTFELKWNKFSNSRLPFYKALVDLFFDSPLEFRCILVKYKDRLSHEEFNGGSHENFYYKMTYFLLKPNNLGSDYKVFLDVINTRGKERLNKIQEIFRHLHNGESPFVSFQHLHTENFFFQLTDLFVGAITYKSRVVAGDFKASHPAKMEFVKYLEERSGYLLEEGTEPWESKFNIFDHQPNMNKNVGQ